MDKSTNTNPANNSLLYYGQNHLDNLEEVYENYTDYFWVFEKDTSGLLNDFGNFEPYYYFKGIFKWETQEQFYNDLTKRTKLILDPINHDGGIDEILEDFDMIAFDADEIVRATFNSEGFSMKRLAIIKDFFEIKASNSPKPKHSPELSEDLKNARFPLLFRVNSKID